MLFRKQFAFADARPAEVSRCLMALTIDGSA